jgi:ribonucleoside-diphosphate reductase alpha chain
MGLKTTYYLRTMGASSIEKSTLDTKSKKFEVAAALATDQPANPATQVTDACSLDDPSCEACQ